MTKNDSIGKHTTTHRIGGVKVNGEDVYQLEDEKGSLKAWIRASASSFVEVRE